ncbi:NTP transferase domain-containing protein [Candidatus Micrarchaeota archaeon]|nr:NTP transferase domain-containing protein [Candidatus Micrarchaeota archaeon]
MAIWRGSVRKAIISSMGLGGRMTPVTRGKIMKIHVEVGGKPVVYHQLQQMKDAGIKEVMILLRNHEQAKEVSQFIEGGKYPEMTYHCMVLDDATEYQRGSNFLRRDLVKPEVQRFIGNDPFLFSHGDNYFQEGAIAALVRRSRQTKKSVFLAETVKLPTKKKVNGHIVPVCAARQQDGGEQYSPSVKAFLLQPRLHQFLYDFFINTPLSRTKQMGLIQVLEQATEHEHPAEYLHWRTWNLNYPIDYERLLQIHSGQADFDDFSRPKNQPAKGRKGR